MKDLIKKIIKEEISNEELKTIVFKYMDGMGLDMVGGGTGTVIRFNLTDEQQTPIFYDKHLEQAFIQYKLTEKINRMLSIDEDEDDMTRFFVGQWVQNKIGDEYVVKGVRGKN